MREIFRDTVLALGVIFAGLSAYFQWRGPVPTDPPAVQQAVSHPIAGLALVGVLFAIAGILNSAPLLLRFMPKRKTEVPDSSLTKSEKTWGDAMAEEDAAKIRERVIEAKQEKRFHYAPGSEPYIEIRTELWNGSVFELVSFGEISGHTKYAERELALEPRVVSRIEPILLTLTHAGKVTLTVRQYVSADVAETMWANKDRSVAVDFESVSVPFKILPPLGCSLEQPERYRWWGPRFSMQDVERV
jgi:hypothetical protein